ALTASVALHFTHSICQAQSQRQASQAPKTLFTRQQEPSFDDRRRSLRLGDLDISQVLSGSVRSSSPNDDFGNDAPKEGTLLMLRSEFQAQSTQESATWAVYEDSGRLETVAQRTTVAQGVTEFTSYVLASPFGVEVRQFLDRAAQVKDAVTFRMSRQSDGSLHFEPGQKGSHFLRFTVAGSTRRGVEPRLELGRNLMLKYDIIEAAPLLEYDISF
ncbi:MAG: hypothetical protein IT290_08110, partial [Deltaproteobacteria bacterium]|nr:hypothetical protein [Deltaproteobacteria bacterium]